MSVDDSSEEEKPPCCKPFRFMELIVTAISFVLLFFLRQFNPEDEVICSSTVLVIFFTTIGSSFCITLIDVMCQGLKIPITNFPMILSLLACFSMCLTSGITAVTVHSLHERSTNLRNLNSLCLLAASSYLGSLLYILDALVVIRFSC